MKKLLALILALAMCFSLVACGGDKKEDEAGKPAASQGGASTDKKDDAAKPGEPDPIKIGVIYPLSGGSATAGASAMWSVNWAVDYINNELGGIQSLGGAKIELIVGDHQGDAEVGLNEFERMVNVENVNVLFGLYSTVVSNSLSQYCIANKVPIQITNAVGNDAFSQPNDYVFHANGATGVNSWAGIERSAWQEERITPRDKYAFVYDSADYGRESYENSLKTMEANGIKEIVGIPIEAGSADFSSQILKLKQDPTIEWVVPSLLMNDAILFCRQMKEYEVAIPIFANGGGFLQADFIEQSGDAGDYVFSTSMWFPSMWKTAWDTELAKEIYDQYYEEMGWLYDESAACAWGGIWALWDALERAGSYDRDDIAKAMKETNIKDEDKHMATLLFQSKSITYEECECPDGSTLYNQNPDAPVPWAMIKDGEYHVVWPEHLAEEGYWQWPIPSWDER